MIKARTLLALAVAVLAVGGAAAPAGASDKPFTLKITPDPVAGGGVETFTATFINKTSQQQLGSANLSWDAPYTLANPRVEPGKSGNAQMRNGVVEIRNLSLPPGHTVRVFVDANLSQCSAGDYTWGVIAKQANNFRGDPGNDLNLRPQTEDADTDVVTTVTCPAPQAVALEFVQQPKDAVVGQTISGTELVPVSKGGPPITVRVVDSAGNTVTSSTATINLATGLGSPALGVLGGDTSEPAVNGIATFDDLTLNQAGAYTLTAASSGLTGDTSDPFDIFDAGTICVDNQPCSVTSGTSNTTVNLSTLINERSDGGSLTLSLNVGEEMSCLGDDDVSHDTALFSGPDRVKVITLTISKQTMNASSNNGAAFLEACFAGPDPFTTKSGVAAPLAHDETGDGVPDWYIGLLPDCSSTAAPPCVSARRKDKAGQGILEVRAPAGDPKLR